ncbi:MAG: hypothetical protein ACXWNV_13495 [Vulcanimicrobiaceae bacterium]
MADAPPAAPPVAKDDSLSAIQDAFDQEHEREAQQEVFLQIQRAQFDFQSEETTELMREYNDTRAMILDQMKHDDEIVKKYIELM